MKWSTLARRFGAAPTDADLLADPRVGYHGAESIRRRIASGSVVALLIIGVVVTTVVRHDAELKYKAATEAHDQAVHALTTTYPKLLNAANTATSNLSIAVASMSAAEDGYVGATEKIAMTSQIEELESAIKKFHTLPRAPRPAHATDEPRFPPELIRAAGELVTESARLDAHRLRELAIVDALKKAMAGTIVASDSLLGSISSVSDELLAAHGSATNLAHIDVVKARTNVMSVPDSSASGVPVLIADYVSSARALEESHIDEEAQKAGPLYSRRIQVEAFARSIAGGVLLDFDWAPRVMGFGASGSYGGTSTWNTSDGGYSTITFTDSVAFLWGVNPAVASLVAHEVGHSITSKCYELYRSSFGENDELWATAWALGMGYTLDGNGESKYGIRPSPALIELSAQCR